MAVRGDSPQERRGPPPANPNFLLCALALPSSSGKCDDGTEKLHDIDPNARKEGERDIRGKQEKKDKSERAREGDRERPLPSGLRDRPVIHKGLSDSVDDVKLDSTPTFSVLADSTPFKTALLEKRNKKGSSLKCQQ